MIINLNRKSFKGLINLEYLFLSDNWLMTAAPGAFHKTLQPQKTYYTCFLFLTGWSKSLKKLNYLSMSGNPKALCPQDILQCYHENSTGFPCCTDKVGNEFVIELLKEEEAKRKKRDADLAVNASKSGGINATDANSTTDTNSTTDNTHKASGSGSWFGGSGSWF
jgi:hypothetical protein